MQASVRQDDGRVMQTGQGIGDLDGCTIVELTDKQATQVRAALSKPNDGVFVHGDGSVTVAQSEA